MKNKKLYLLSLVLFFFSIKEIYSHEEWVHRYITTEAWKMLKRDRPDLSCSEMNCYMGSYNDFLLGNYPWEMGKVITGSSREDVEDVVWGYTCPSIPPFEFHYTNTHFWNADEGYDETHDIIDDACCSPFVFNCGNYPNAWTKMQKYMNGDYILKKEFRTQGGQLIIENTFTKQGGGTYTLQSHGPIGFRYYGLQNLYNTGHMTITHFTQSNGAFVEINPHVEIIAYFNKKIVYETLGRMCHLLQDQCVPAHAHVDTHPDGCGCGDSYETRMGIDFRNWSYQNSGNYIDPFIYDNSNPVKFLMYTSNQLADFFASNDRDGDNTSFDYASYMATRYPMNLYPAYTYSNIFTGHGSSGVSTSTFNEIGNVCQKQAIKATAGLLYWFIVTANTPMNNCDAKITNLNFNYNSNPKIFWNENGIFTPTVTGTGPINYFWKYYKCGQLNNGCGSGVLPEELSFPNGFSNSIFKIHNNRYETVNCLYGNQNCGSQYNNLSLYIRLIAYNSCTSDTMYYSNFVLPWNSVRPPPPPGGGCPFVFVWNNDSILYATENNLLHRSEFAEFADQDIKDLYKLQIKPNLNFGKYSIQIGEGENDHNYFDQVKLYAVDHPIGTKIGVTEANDIVMYDTTIVQSTDDANKNGTDITDYIQYYYQGKKIISGNAGDNIYAHYDSTGQMRAVARMLNKYGNLLNRSINDSVALIGNLDREPIGPKNWGGVCDIFIGGGGGQLTRPFAIRENMSTVIIPFAENVDAVDHVDINWSSDYSMTYFAVVPIMYSGFDVTEVPLSEAIHSLNNENVTSNILNTDQVYIELDSSDYVTMMFDSIPDPQPGMQRDFVIETSGRYVSGGSLFRPSNVSSLNSNNPVTHVFQLHTNYPNPFNPKTMIKYEIGKTSLVKLSIYNVLGQLINVLINEVKNSGDYSIEFDGSNLPSGIYIYKIVAGDYIESKKMLLIK